MSKIPNLKYTYYKKGYTAKIPQTIFTKEFNETNKVHLISNIALVMECEENEDEIIFVDQKNWYSDRSTAFNSYAKIGTTPIRAGNREHVT